MTTKEFYKFNNKDWRLSNMSAGIFIMFGMICILIIVVSIQFFYIKSLDNRIDGLERSVQSLINESAYLNTRVQEYETSMSEQLISMQNLQVRHNSYNYNRPKIMFR